ncbi:MAG TPA: amidohydrolase family protein [Solirubrobacterales bacterium]|nr:amidohydrolase family protein [Solirubrobacterales bacterium]
MSLPTAPQVIVGNVITMDPGGAPRAEAFAVAAGVVVVVGSREEATAALPGAPVREPAGESIVPGLIDSHLHMQWAGLKLLERFGEAGPPSLAAALECLDDPGSHWTGAADPTLAERLAALRLIQPVLHRLGIVGVVDPAVVPAEMSGYVHSHNRGELTMRVVPMPHPDIGKGADAAIAQLDGIGARTGLGDERLRLGGVKVYFDGEGKNSSALRREPWPEKADDPDGRGWQRLPDEEFLKIAAWCAREGWSMGVHVVGGGGIDRVLDAWLKVDRETPIAGLGFTLIHAYLEPSPANMELAAKLGVLVAAQPAIHHRNGVGLEARLGPEARAANPMGAWLDAGVPVGGGSDGPYFPIDPRLGLWQARTREVEGDEEPHAPELALSAEQALAIYTTGAAAVSLAAGRRGAIAPGQAADWVALSVDPLTADPAAVREMTALETAVGGVIVNPTPGA